MAPQLLQLPLKTVNLPQFGHFVPRPPLPLLGGIIISYPHLLHFRFSPVVLKKVRLLQWGHNFPANFITSIYDYIFIYLYKYMF